MPTPLPPPPLGLVLALGLFASMVVYLWYVARGK